MGGGIVEFVGLPGAGKSTVAPLLTRALASRGWSCGNREMMAGLESPRLLRYSRLLQFFLRHPSEIQAVVRLGSSAPSPTPMRLVQGLKYVSVWSSRFGRARRQAHRVWVLDQGVLQDAWSLMLRGIWRDEIVQAAVSRTIVTSGIPYLLVYFDIDAGLAVKRIAQRPTMESMFDRLDPVEAERQLALQGQRLEHLFTRVAEMTGSAHCRIDAAQTPADVCAEIETRIEALIRPTALEASPIR